MTVDDSARRADRKKPQDPEPDKAQCHDERYGHHGSVATHAGLRSPASGLVYDPCRRVLDGGDQHLGKQPCAGGVTTPVKPLHGVKGPAWISTQAPSHTAQRSRTSIDRAAACVRQRRRQGPADIRDCRARQHKATSTTDVVPKRQPRRVRVGHVASALRCCGQQEDGQHTREAGDPIDQTNPRVIVADSGCDRVAGGIHVGTISPFPSGGVDRRSRFGGSTEQEEVEGTSHDDTRVVRIVGEEAPRSQERRGRLDLVELIRSTGPRSDIVESHALRTRVGLHESNVGADSRRVER